MSAPAQLTPQELQDKAYYLFVTNAIGVVSFSVLLYDHLITFGDEVAVIWSRAHGRRNGPLIYLFIILRYFAPIGYTVQLCSYFISPNVWTPEICARYVVFEGCMTVSALGIVALMMMIRVYALYGRSYKILAFLMSLFILQFVVQGWLLSSAIPVKHDPIVLQGLGVAGCSMLFSPSVGAWATASAWLPVVYDAIIFALTAYKTAHVLRRRNLRNRNLAGPAQGEWIMKTLLRDGSLYFFVILISNVPLMIMIGVAPDGIKNVAAQWEFLITVTMMSRITLSLRREDIAWQIGTTMAADGRDDAQSTVFFAHEEGRAGTKIKMKNLAGRGGSLPRGSASFASTDVGGGPSFASSRTAVSAPVNLKPPAVDQCWFPPTPIIETGDEDDEEDREDYFDDGTVRDGGRRPYDLESDAASSRVVDLFRPYSNHSVLANANAHLYDK
ncbi:hypothetical protein EXIGLDRAFT_735783 [Exidia glandulosa HHB12029]|uniref:DUF6533 domain-containing protein n=1 Tax=Exidia glandulosa HHB12029 TaxID=1314781 RepID=A0A165PKX5_EXIGL|nr:hypothetical protein EXIGLDRAFT_735783 [Exidia glandulosa HHB12029]